MNRSLKIKVCGMRDGQNIAQAGKLVPDMMGFIFWEKSARDASGLDPKTLRELSKNTLRTGVFVDPDDHFLLDKVMDYKLSAVQLHGDESPEYCALLRRRDLLVIKAFGVDENFEFQSLEPYLANVDYFLFDTRTAGKGGSGRQFDWSVLERYRELVPFFLSGGIGEDELQRIKDLSHPSFCGVDLNSRFEMAPGLKDVDALARFFAALGRC